MPHRKLTHDDLVEIIRTLVTAHDLYFRNEEDPDVKRILKEMIEYARGMVTPTEFVAERCPDTPDFFNDESTPFGGDVTPSGGGLEMSPDEPKLRPGNAT